MDIVKEALECWVLDLIKMLVARNNPLRKESFELSLVPEGLETRLKTNETEKKRNIQRSGYGKYSGSLLVVYQGFEGNRIPLFR